ncbi:MAG: LTA synthase family protein [Erysipelotrichaceae bacterium]
MNTELMEKKKNVFKLKNCVYKKNLKRTFLSYCIKNKYLRIGIVIDHIILYFKLKIRNVTFEIYQNQYWSYLSKLCNLSDIVDAFWSTQNNCINKQFKKLRSSDYLIIDDAPIEIFSTSFNGFSKSKVMANHYDLQEKCFIEYKEVDDVIIKSLNDSIVNNLYSDIENKSYTYFNNLYILVNNKFIRKGKQLFKYKMIWYLITALIVFISSALLSLVSLHFSTGTFSNEMFKYYLSSNYLIILNFLPILLLFLFIICITNRIWIGYSITSIIVITFSLINFFKLQIRDDPFIFSDINLFTESIMMAGRYTIVFTRGMKIMIIGLIISIPIVRLFTKVKFKTKKVRILSLILICMLSKLSYDALYTNTQIYDKYTLNPMINRWSGTQQFITRGFVYPFVHSINDSKLKKPEGYDDDKAISILKNYKNTNIEDNKKVNIISIMLEAYNDFSKFDSINFNVDVYDKLHQLQQESYYGNLVTNIFGGGTIDTEQSYITGYSQIPNIRSNTNSYVHYFNDQGYYTEGSHPINGWFYNRKNANEYLGYNNYYFKEHRYDFEDGWKDEYFLNDIKKLYNMRKQSNIPYFNFSVSYQNHGPYPTEKMSNDFIKWKDTYNEDDFNRFNNYLAGIQDTTNQIYDFVNSFRNDKEPVVIVLFGDHNPSLGDENSCYNMLDINLDLSDIEGFENYYSTPYLIWGNQAAKRIVDSEIKGNGPNISPNFLMNELFNCLNYQGSNFMQVSQNLEKNVDVVNSIYFKENDKYVERLSKENQKKLEEYKIVEYYYETHFNK